jgi:cellobiose phosphorylase
LKKTIGLCEGSSDVVSEMETEIRLLCNAIEEHGFDGKWYRRGYYDDGSVLGGKERTDCKIDLLPQAFASIVAHECGFAKERTALAMRSVGKMLFDRKHLLVRLLYPPFDRDEQSPGYIKGYVPGIRENGGQYTHAAVWAALGFFLCGDVTTATEVMLAINPAERYLNPEIAKAYRIEPYVFAGDVYTNPQHIGRGGWSFYTGSAAWYRKVALEILCGYTEERDGFYLKPHLSEAFDSFSIAINKKETSYRINVSLADEMSLALDGEAIANAEDYCFRFDGGAHEGVLKVRK